MLAHTSSSVSPASGIANWRSRIAGADTTTNGALGTRLGNWLAVANGWTVVLWPATPTSKGAFTAEPQFSEITAGRSGGAGQIPPITFPAPGLIV